ncbi:methyl-accepting chemotaxis protein [Neptuniibacter caesariensis]|uniref:Methyl-accepting chemotaxis protein (Contains HAMP domain) n=1 Tax=Neptuniibacter caesariensis TaxID=207954 RepID=A0A7U8GTF7_NEPCE|nr:methyl-accepting chemotaxis protein [Neptuniibacter caesariensis]EAR62278.1 Methyl-accepting chemotaxis protein (contains HAMP domain) [Oceanospirillum sp. MED92] [Neptuniibacter caesariensis]
MLLGSLKIATRIYLLAGLMLGLISMVGGVAIFQMNKIGIELIDIAEEDIPITNALSKVTQHQLEQAILFERSLTYATALNFGEQRNSELTSTLNKFSQLSDKVNNEFKELEQLIDEAIVKTHSEAAKLEFTQLLTTIMAIDKDHKQYEGKALSLLEQMQNGAYEQARSSVDSVIALEEKIDHGLVEALAKTQDFTLQATRQAEKDELDALKAITILFGIALFIGIAVPAAISRSVTSPVKEMRNRLRELAEGDGDLRVRLPIKGKDETTEASIAFNTLMEKLGIMINSIKSTSTTLVQSSENTIVVMEATRDQVTQQKNETELVANSVQEMAASVTQIAQSTEHAASLGSDVLNNVKSGSSMAMQNQNVIQELVGNVDNAASQLTTLAEETDRISEVLNNIRGIAEQTNLLALNAAIEAARAGESGRGFAVVADEVRSLSQRTQSSTEDIQELLQRLQTGTTNAVSIMREGQNNAETCIQHSEKTTAELNDATHAVENMAAMNTQIAAAAEEQSAVVREIHTNLASISEYASSTNDSANQTAEINRGMSLELKQLNSMVSELKA